MEKGGGETKSFACLTYTTIKQSAFLFLTRPSLYSRPKSAKEAGFFELGRKRSE